MISLDIKTKPSSAIESIIAQSDKNSTSQEKDTLSFAELLKGVSVQKDAKETVQNGLLVLSLAATSKEVTEQQPQKLTNSPLGITTLLNEVEKNQEKIIPLELNPKITKNLSIDELKSLIKDAKEYLKKQIIQNSDFKKSEIIALPKTIKGLIQVAKKFNIDVSKITVEEIQVTKSDLLMPAKKLLTVDAKEIKQTDVPFKNNEEEVLVKIKKGVLTNEIDKTKEKLVSKGVEIKPVVITNEKLVSKGVEVKPLLINKESIKEVKQKIEKLITTKTNSQNTESIQRVENLNKDDSLAVEQKRVQFNNEIGKTPLFKAQESKEITTQQLVATKLNTTHNKTPKQKTEDTLELLLRGTKSAKKETSLTTEFSVATARVLVSSNIKESTQNFESLLHGDFKEESKSVATKIDTLVTTETLNVSKADSFEVKLNEAKQMIKYISQDVKTAIENYKAPFTRVKLQLNPQRLGEVDLIIVQRGKNLHINLSSNNVAINTLALNANELKVQLNNSGINNASLNFNNNSQGSDSNAQQQQNSQQQQRGAREEYKYFDNQERNEEIINSLEIVVPNYA